MWFIYALIVVVCFILMESVAWLAHKYLMHGSFWHLHRDHHKRDDGQFFEKNDYFFLIFATPGILLFLLGTLKANGYLIAVAAGITLYGLCYFLVHDIFIHQRFKIFRNTDNIYFMAIRRAHKAHHKHLSKEYGECFGMLWVPKKYFTEARKILKNKHVSKVKQA